VSSGCSLAKCADVRGLWFALLCFLLLFCNIGVRCGRVDAWMDGKRHSCMTGHVASDAVGAGVGLVG